MICKLFFVGLLAFLGTASISAQSSSSAAYRAIDPVSAISSDIAKITVSVQTLNATLQAFVDKFEKVSGLTMTEKQQRLVLGMELLTRTELRVVTLQKAQIELTEKLNATRNRLSQVENDLRPRNVLNSTTLEGTTEADEVRESKRQRLQSERNSLAELDAQIRISLAETGSTLRDAQALAERLRRSFLPQVERELYDQ